MRDSPYIELMNEIKLKKTDQTYTYPFDKNRVLGDDYRNSTNYYESDLILQHFIKRRISIAGQSAQKMNWMRLGSEVANEVDALSLQADKNGPKLIKRNFLGETIDEIEFHPAYERMKQIAVDSDLFRIKWLPENRNTFDHELHKLGFATDFLFSMSEMGLNCPLCMTDGVARLIDQYCIPEDRRRLLKGIYTAEASELMTGAMFLTEKGGGSDVGANIVTAKHYLGDYYKLNGEKWFCSNVNADIVFALARTNPNVKGTKGLSIFLIEKTKPNGARNPLNIVRLKEKLGVRSMASAECMLEDTVGKLVGKEGQGFYIMSDMVNLSRLYNSVTAIAGMRRAMIEVYEYLSARKSFGKNALQHAMIREHMMKLSCLYISNFYITMHATHLLDQSDNGDEEAAHFLRLLTPMIKRDTAENSIYIIRECMELMGGMGYIEDGIMPKLYRDALVLPIWEGAGNIMVLDMLRATFKSSGLALMLEYIKNNFVKSTYHKEELLKTFMALQDRIISITEMEQDEMEVEAKYFFQDLGKFLQIAVLMDYNDDNAPWVALALVHNIDKLVKPNHHDIPSLEILQQVMAWDF